MSTSEYCSGLWCPPLGPLLVFARCSDVAGRCDHFHVAAFRAPQLDIREAVRPAVVGVLCREVPALDARRAGLACPLEPAGVVRAARLLPTMRVHERHYDPCSEAGASGVVSRATGSPEAAETPGRSGAEAVAPLCGSRPSFTRRSMYSKFAAAPCI